MGVINIKKDEHFITSGTHMQEIYWLVKGKINQLSQDDELIFESGSVIGIPECSCGEYLCDYVALEDSTCYTYPFRDKEDLKKIYETQPKYSAVFVMAVIKTTMTSVDRFDACRKKAKQFYKLCIDMQRQYKFLTTKMELPEKNLHRIDYLKQVSLSNPLPLWKVEYYEELVKQPLANLEAFYGNNIHLLGGFILSAGDDIERAIHLADECCDYFAYSRDILLCEDRADLFQLFFDLAKKTALMGKDYTSIVEKLQEMKAFILEAGFFEEDLIAERMTEFDTFDFASYAIEHEDSALEQDDSQVNTEENSGEDEEGEDCFAHIMRYAGATDAETERIREQIITYRELPDILATDDDTRRLRRSLSEMFYNTYLAAFKHALNDSAPSPIVQMFLNFGFMDVSLVGSENANTLYDLTDHLFLCESDDVYTIYTWLKSIYEGKNEPSRNDFDMDYPTSLREEKRQGHITALEEEKLLQDQWNKVVFEVRNMFTTNNRATYGKISTFCPILAKHDLIDSPSNMLMTVNRLQTALDAIRDIDYSVFYHDVMFSDPEHGITKEILKKEVLPQIILMPNAGNRAMMWQETAGTRRDTPARFVFPIFTKIPAEDLMAETVARYRWEYCRRVQGARWNDVTDKSLTAEYCDYLQFYRKNRDLTTEAKEKLRNDLFRAKNNYREVFVKDYVSWLKYEAYGSFRLNKLTRGILLSYCPFSARYRLALSGNPMFQSMLERWQILKDREKKRVDAVFDRYEKNGGEMKPEILAHLEYYEK